MCASSCASTPSSSAGGAPAMRPLLPPSAEPPRPRPPLEPPRRPVWLGGVASARAVQRRDVLERDQDVAVQLEVGDVFDEAVGGEDAVLVVASEERDLDLFAFVFVGVILHRGRNQSSRRSRPSSAAKLATKQLPIAGPRRRASACEIPSAAAIAARIGPPWVIAVICSASCRTARP